MVDVKKGIKVEDFIKLLEPFKDMDITFTKTEDIGVCRDCYCGINLQGNEDNVKLEIVVDF